MSYSIYAYRLQSEYISMCEYKYIYAYIYIYKYINKCTCCLKVYQHII